MLCSLNKNECCNRFLPLIKEIYFGLLVLGSSREDFIFYGKEKMVAFMSSKNESSEMRGYLNNDEIKLMR